MVESVPNTPTENSMLDSCVWEGNGQAEEKGGKSSPPTAHARARARPGEEGKQLSSQIAAGLGVTGSCGACLQLCCSGFNGGYAYTAWLNAKLTSVVS